jgi:hypothetical protein
VHRRVPIDLVSAIGVRTQAQATAVQHIVVESGAKIAVTVQPRWYY